MIWLLSAAFGLGGSLLISISFSESFERERISAQSAYRMTLNTLQVVNDVSSKNDYSDIVSTVEQMKSQESASWSGLRLGIGDEVLCTDSISDKSFPEHPLSDPAGTVSVIRDTSDRRHILIRGMIDAGREDLTLDISYDISAIYEQRARQIVTYRRVFTAMVIIGAGISWALAYWLTKPLAGLSAASKRFAGGDLSYRAPVRSSDEIGLLAQDFNRMAEKIEDNINELQDVNRRQEDFMGSFAHEMKNPMTAIIGYAELIRGQMLSEKEQMDAANYIFSEGKRLESLSLKLLDLIVMKKEQIELKPVSPEQLIGSMAEHLKPIYLEKGIVLQYKCEPGTCLMEPDLIKSLLVNLMDNARKAMENGGNLYISSEMTDDGCIIRVLDTGRGIPEEKIAHLTEAFYRVDKSRSRAQGGVGLGLSLCNEIVRLHKGTLKFESRVGNGTCVTAEVRCGRA